MFNDTGIVCFHCFTAHVMGSSEKRLGEIRIRKLLSSEGIKQLEEGNRIEKYLSISTYIIHLSNYTSQAFENPIRGFNKETVLVLSLSGYT